MTAIEELHAERIGHGYKALECDRIVQFLQCSKIHLECCLTSSVQTGAFKGRLNQHPITEFRKLAIPFSLSTDDPIICTSTLNQEYLLAYNQAGLSFDSITDTILNAIHVAFLPATERNALSTLIQTRIAEAKQRLAVPSTL
jgi:adenosine deaminase